MVDVVFAGIAIFVVVTAILALEAKELIYGAVSLGLMLFGIAALYLLLNAALVAMFQITIYIGAIVVLILFTIVLVRRMPGEHLEDERPVEKIVAIVAGVTLFGAVASIFLATQSLVAPIEQAYTVQNLAILLIDQNYFGPLLFVIALVVTSSLLGALTLAKSERRRQSA